MFTFDLDDLYDLPKMQHPSAPAARCKQPEQMNAGDQVDATYLYL